MTNYERITESPEKLAEFLDEVGDCWKFQDMGICPNMKCRCEHGDCKSAALAWLQEECND